METIEQFRFWCQKILPIVYDDSLSYYETLCKLVAKMNEIINAINHNDWEKIVIEEINKYFNSIMIDAMYDKPSRTITFARKEIVVKDGLHIYTADNSTMDIKE